MARLARAVVPDLPHHVTQRGNRGQRTGHLWQGRFTSFTMDERHTIAAAKYVELNPVRAGLVDRADDYAWSSARAHTLGRDDGLVIAAPLLDRVGDWSAFLRTGPGLERADDFRKHEGTGRPLGSDAFIDMLERRLQRSLRPRKPGPPSKLARLGDLGMTQLRMVSPEPERLRNGSRG